MKISNRIDFQEKIMKKLLLLVVLCFLAIPFAALAEIPRVLNYQGYVESAGGVPIDGPGYFKFAIVNQAGDTSFWSNDGTSTTGNEPSYYVVATVSGGFFSLKLGDTDIANMVALDDFPFENQHIFVRVWFSASGSSFQQLAPDTQIASAAFAYKAQTVEEVPPGTVDWIDLAGIPEDFSDGVDNVGITSESDPTVAASVKDGVSWKEVADIPAGFADGVDNVGIGLESDPTVAESVKDGVSWKEVLNMPAGFADGTDNVNDPRIGTLKSGMCCLSDGKTINCTMKCFSVITPIAGFSTSDSTNRRVGLDTTKDIEALPYGIQDAVQLFPVAFRSEDQDGSKPQELGFIAQDVEKIIPEAVAENDGIKAISYSSLIPVLTNAIKDQQKQIEQLKMETEVLRNKIKDLESSFQDR